MSGAWIESLNGVTAPWAEAMLRATWQGGLALAGVWGICRVWPSLPSGPRCWLWRLAYLKLLVALAWIPSVDLAVLPARPVPAPVVSPTVPAAVPSSQPRAQASQPRQQAVAPLSAPAVAARVSGVTLLGLLWLLGAGAIAVGIWREWRSAGRALRACRALDDPSLIEICERLRQRFGLRQLPELMISPATTSPWLSGIRRPRIVLPTAGQGGWPSAGSELMLAHELAHVQRRDLLWNWLPAVSQTLFWFHPLVWLIGHEWRLAQEMACDEAALQVTNTTPADYCDMLLKVATQRLPQAGQRLATVGIVETYEALRRRVAAMKAMGGRVPRAWAAAGVLVAAVGAVSLVPWRVTAQARSGTASSGAPSSHEQSHARLEQLGTALMMYSQDYDEVLPPLADAAAVKRYLLPYLRNDESLLIHPLTRAPYQTNASLSGKQRETVTRGAGTQGGTGGKGTTRRSEIARPGETVVLYEATPAADGTRGVLLMDGRVARVPERVWPLLRRASGLEGPAAAHPLGFASVDELWLLPFPGVQTDLGLTDDQVAAVEAAGKAWERESRAAQSLPPTERDAVIEARRRAAYDPLYRSLSLQQMQRLYQFSLQVNGAVSLLRNEMQRELGLSPVQRGAILALLLDQHDAESTLVNTIENDQISQPERNEAMRQLPKLRRESYEKALALLTDPQQERWQQLIGPPADLKVLIVKG
jgi:beta-lactamase regulating signal transducer with metallopeptidase domain